MGRCCGWFGGGGRGGYEVVGVIFQAGMVLKESRGRGWIPRVGFSGDGGANRDSESSRVSFFSDGSAFGVFPFLGVGLRLSWLIARSVLSSFFLSAAIAASFPSRSTFNE